MPTTTEQVRAFLAGQRDAALNRYNKVGKEIANLLETIKSLNESLDTATAVQKACEREAEELRTAIAILEHADQNEDIERFSSIDKEFFTIKPHRYHQGVVSLGNDPRTLGCSVVFGPYADAELCMLPKNHPIHSDPDAPSKASFSVKPDTGHAAPGDPDYRPDTTISMEEL